uniref:Calmodulin 3 n=1 Tax=Homo sapiens TaxID=9606 RepID=A0A590UJD7_HUMAN
MCVRAHQCPNDTKPHGPETGLYQTPKAVFLSWAWVI